MSIWDNSSGGLVRPGTPEVIIRYQRGKSGAESWVVLADGQEVERTTGGYRAAHVWAQNTYQLTSTPMTAVYADYEQARQRDYPQGGAEAAQSNPYRKGSA